jgi:hypothetical protein
VTTHLPLQADDRRSDGHATGPPVPNPAPALLRAALDASAEAIVVCTAADDTVVLVNAAAAELVPDLRPGRRIAGGPLTRLSDALAEGAEALTDY